MTVPNLDSSEGKTEAQCSVERFSVTIAASMVVRNDIEEIWCSLQEERARGENETMHP